MIISFAGKMKKRSSSILLISRALSLLAVSCCLLGVTAGRVNGDAPAAVKSGAGVVDLNTATQTQLETLKGVGAATAKKIIAGRPYHSVDELAGKGVPEKTIEMIRPLVTAGGVGAPSVPPSPAMTMPAMRPGKVPSAAQAPPASGPLDVNTASETS